MESDEKSLVALGRKIDAVRKSKGLTLVQLADQAGYDERTIRNLIAGKPSRIKTVHDVCTRLGINLESDDQPPSTSADERHGGYPRGLYTDYIGRFYAHRRAFSLPRTIIKSLFQITWSDTFNCLQFEETHRYEAGKLKVDNSQTGEIFISNSTDLLSLVSCYKGATRMITVSKLRPDDLTMHGVVLTQAKRAIHYLPAVSPFFFQKTDETFSVSELIKGIGPIDNENSDYERLNELLCEIERNIAVFALERQPHALREVSTRVA